MYLIRFLLITLAIWLAIVIIRQLITRPAKQVARRTVSGDMVRCAHCGLHLPKEEALREGDAYFCSQEHLLEDRRR